MKTLGSAPESRDPETRAALEKDASSFLDDLARWTSELKASGADLEPAPVRPRSGPGVAPIRNVPAATVVARGPRDKKASDEKASSSAGAPNPPPPPPSDAAFAEATSRALGLDDGGAAASALRDFADSASKKDSDVVDLSVPGASNAEKTLAAMAGASASERTWVARREREKGNELFRAREYSSAVDAYALALALDPACVAARSNRAAANMKLRRWRDAVADCDAVIAAEPEHVKALARRGESRLELHPGEGDANARAALADLEKAAAIEPGNAHVRALERRARKAVAETAPTRRVAIETEEEEAGEDGAAALEKKTEEPKKKPKAAERFEAAREGPMVIEEVEDEPAEDEPAEPRQVSESRRRVVIEEEESEESEESEDEAAASDERNARHSRDARHSAETKVSTPAWALEKEKGNAAFGRGDFHAARERYDAALALVPASDASASATLLANRAAARLKLGEYAAAASDASAALAKDPRYVKAYHRRACARRELGDFEGALEDYEEVVRADPTNERIQAEVEACMRGAAEKMLGGFGGEIGGGDAGARGGGGGVAVPIQADSDDDTDEEEDAPEARRPGEENASTPDAPPGTSRRRVAIVEEDSESEDERGEDAEDVSRRDADPPAARDPPGAAGGAVSASEDDGSHSSATQSHSSAAIAKMSAELEATRLELEARKREVARAEDTRARAKARADECAEELRAADAKKAEAAALVEASAEKARAEVEGPSAGPSGVSSDPASGSAAPLPSELRNVAESCKLRGNKLFKMGEHARAAEAYGEALAIDPANASYLANRAAAYLKLEAFRDALVDADSALATDPAHDRARHRRAAALFALGAFRDAAEEYDRVVAANPTHGGVKAEAERAWARAREEEVREASARAEEGKAEAASDEKKLEKKAEKAEKAPPPPSVPSPPAPSPPSRKLRPAPRTATDLERGLASLRGDADALLGFASLVPPADLPKLVRESVSPAMLGAYAEATARAAERANEDAKALAHALATAKALAGVPRFAANAMMMKRADKETMRAALERVGGEDAREIADAWKL